MADTGTAIEWMPPKMGCKKKSNVSNSETEVLLEQIEQHKHVTFHSVSTGITGSHKHSGKNA